MRSSVLTGGAAIALALPVHALADPPATKIQPIDLGQVFVGIGGLGRFDEPGGGSIDLVAGAQGAEVEFKGLYTTAGTFAVFGRPALGTTEFYASALRIDWMFFGHSTQTESVCIAFPTLSCDSTTGILGFGAELASFHGVLQGDRREVRVLAGDVILSPTHAFDAAWAQRRAMFRAGATLDSIAPHGFDSHTWVGRLDVGADAGVAAGPFHLDASVRWRPNFLDFVGDWGLEARVDVVSAQAWEALVGYANLRVGGAIVYQHWSAPKWAFGADRVDGAMDSLTVRLTLTPSLFSMLQ